MPPVNANGSQAGPRTRNWRLDSCLEVAVYNNNLKWARKLLHAGADPNLFTFDEEIGYRSPLLFAATDKRRVLLLDALLKAGAEPGLKDSDGFTALHLVTARANCLGMHLLLRAGANPNAKSHTGATPLHSAREAGPAALLLAHGAWPDGMSHPQRELSGLKHGSSVPGVRRQIGRMHSVERRCRTPLHLAASRGCTEVVGLLVRAGANVNARDHVGRTALHRAARAAQVATLISLLGKGASVDAQDWEGNTALHYAAMVPLPAVAAALLSAGADLNARNGRVRTPLDLSIGRHAGQECLAAVMLLQAGAVAPPGTLSRLLRFAVRRAASSPHAAALIDCVCRRGANLAELADVDFMLLVRGNTLADRREVRAGLCSGVRQVLRLIVKSGGSIPANLTAELL